MIKKCCSNKVAAFAKLSHVTYVRTATNGNMSVVAPNLKKGCFAVATYNWRLCLSTCKVRWFEEGPGIDITE